MSIKSIVLTLFAGFSLTAAAIAQAPPTGARAAAPTTSGAAIEPSIAFAFRSVMALRSNGDLLTWGAQDENCALGRQVALFKNYPDPGVLMHNVKEIAAAGTANHLALTVDGDVYSWGTTITGRYACDGPSRLEFPAKVAHIVEGGGGSGGAFAVAVTESGDLYCAGGEVACPANSSRNPDSSFRSSAPDGVRTFTRLNLPELNGNVLEVRAGGGHTLVLTKDRKLYAFGLSRWGQLGNTRFTQGGAIFGFTPQPVLTNVVSFAAGLWHSVAVTDDGTVWTWGHNEDTSELCDGTTTNRRVPTQLTALAGQVVQVAAAQRSTLMRTKAGAIYGCGGNYKGQLGLDPGANRSKLVTQPTQVSVPPVRSSLLVVGDDFSALSPDGCTVYFTDPNSPRFALRAGLSLCAPRSATPLPDLAEGALRPIAPAPKSVDCWIPKVERFPKDARLAPMRQAMLATERLIKENEVFIPQLPEGVRMWFYEDAWKLTAYAYPRQAGPYPQWSTTSCNVLAPNGLTVDLGGRVPAIGQMFVNFNTGFPPVSSSRDLNPSRYVAGFPVFHYANVGGAIDTIFISQDGRFPVIPSTLADRLDFLAESSTNELEREHQQQARPEREADLRRQLETLRAYRASFSADQLRAAWVEGDMQGAESRQLEERVKALEALTPQDQAQVNDLATRARDLQRQALTRGIAPQEATRLRNEANVLLQQANSITLAQQKRVAPEVTAMRSDFLLRRNRPGDASQARQFKEDPTFYDKSDPSRIRMITVSFSFDDSRETSRAQAKAWMDKVEATFDYQALKALIR
jgi:alpha-tubulin suppressor-like RCC1 family protein